MTRVEAECVGGGELGGAPLREMEVNASTRDCDRSNAPVTNEASATGDAGDAVEATTWDLGEDDTDAREGGCRSTVLFWWMMVGGWGGRWSAAGVAFERETEGGEGGETPVSLSDELK